MIPTKSNFKSFHGVLMVLSVVASFIAFQDFATPAQSRMEVVRTEWVASQRGTKRTISYDGRQTSAARLVSPPGYRLIEVNYARGIRTALASITAPPRIPSRNVLEKTVAGLPEPNPAHQG